MSGVKVNFPDNLYSLGNSQQTTSVGGSQTNIEKATHTPEIATVRPQIMSSGEVAFQSNNVSSSNSTHMVSGSASRHSSYLPLPQSGYKHGGPSGHSLMGVTSTSKSCDSSQKHTPSAVASSSYNDIKMGDISQGSIMRFVNAKLLPTKLKMIDDKWATQNWHFANHLNKDLPTMNPSHQHVEDYCSELMKMWNNVYNKLHDNLLLQLQGLSRNHFRSLIESQQPAKKIQAIHNQVLRSSTKCDEEYLKRVLEFFKGP